MRFQVKNSEIFPMPGGNSHMLHLGTISMGMREFCVMYCVRGPKFGNLYIEEVVLTSVDFDKDVYAHSKFIKDDALAYDLAKFAEEKGMTDMVAIANRLFSTGRGSWLMGDLPK